MTGRANDEENGRVEGEAMKAMEEVCKPCPTRLPDIGILSIDLGDREQEVEEILVLFGGRINLALKVANRFHFRHTKRKAIKRTSTILYAVFGCCSDKATLTTKRCDD